MRQFVETLYITANSWALAGCFDCSYESSSIKYAHWQACLEYVWDVEERGYKALELYSEDSSLQYVMACEVSLRTRAIELARSSEQLLWGIALKQAMKDEAQTWQDN
eukprot:3076486-Karenia_brevis.AAC.1